MISDETWSFVLECIANGLSNIDACNAAGISKTAFYDKRNADSDFSDALKKAEVKFKLSNLRNIIKAGKRHWQASAWLLERKFKKEFSRVEFQENLPDEFAGKSDAELNKMLADLEREDDEYEGKNREENTDSPREKEE